MEPLGLTTSLFPAKKVGGPSRGTRFRPLSLDLPKVLLLSRTRRKAHPANLYPQPLFDIAGHPLIWHPLTAVAKVPSIKEVYLIGYYEESVFAPYIREWSAEFPQFSIKYLREYTALGTAGGLYHFRDAIMAGNPKRLFVLNSDVCCSFPLKEMLEMFEEKEAEAVILGTKVGDDAARNFGCKWHPRTISWVYSPLRWVSNPTSVPPPLPRGRNRPIFYNFRY